MVMLTWNEIGLASQLLACGAIYIHLSTLIEIIFVAVESLKQAFVKIAVEATGDSAVRIVADDQSGKVGAGHQKAGVTS